MILRHALLAAVITGIAATASAQTPSTAPGQPPATTVTTDMPAPNAADARKLIGRNVKNPNNDTIGEIKSVYITPDGKVDSVMVGVGGFLGVGEREVRLAWKDLQVMDNGEKVVVNMTKDQLKAQPPYQYADQKYRGTVFGDSTPRPAPQARPGAPDDRRTMTDNARPRTGGAFNSAGDVAASALVGATVKNGQNETVGSIDDVYVDPNGSAKSVVISVGGFLGVGARHINIPWSAVKVQREGDRSLVVLINATKDSLKAMPEYKYGN